MEYPGTDYWRKLILCFFTKSNNQIFRNVIERVKVYSGQYPSSNKNFASNWNINFRSEWFCYCYHSEFFVSGRSNISIKANTISIHLGFPSLQAFYLRSDEVWCMPATLLAFYIIIIHFDANKWKSMGNRNWKGWDIFLARNVDESTKWTIPVVCFH